jgi:hypothetical protein
VFYFHLCRFILYLFSHVSITPCADLSTGIRLHLNRAVLSALKKYANLELRDLCARVAALPRELADPIYHQLLEGLDQELVFGCIRDRIKTRRWWKRPSYLDINIVGHNFLYELMETYYTTTSFDLGSTRLYSSEDTAFDFKLWSLLAKDPFNTECVPARLIRRINVNMCLAHWGRFNADKCLLIEPPRTAKRISDAKCRIVIKASYEDTGPRCRQRHPKVMTAKVLLKHLEPALTRLTALGFNVQLLFGQDERVIYP